MDYGLTIRTPVRGTFVAPGAVPGSPQDPPGTHESPAQPCPRE
jgi:hypothetical protein